MSGKLAVTTIFVGLIVFMLATVLIGSRNSKENLTSGAPIDQETTADLQDEGSNILYWGTTCPYCHDVIDWIEMKNVHDKISIELKEVYENRQNSLELISKAKSCGLSEYGIGVPFMYTSDGKCLIGAPDIINHLSTELQKSSMVQEEVPIELKGEEE